MTKLLQKRCQQHKNFVAEIASFENKMIGEIKEQGKARIEKMLLLGINPHQAKVIETLYFSKDNGEITQEATADLLDQMKNSENILVNEEKLLEQYRKEAEKKIGNLKEMGELAISKRTSDKQQ